MFLKDAWDMMKVSKKKKNKAEAVFEEIMAKLCPPKNVKTPRGATNSRKSKYKAKPPREHSILKLKKKEKIFKSTRGKDIYYL